MANLAEPSPSLSFASSSYLSNGYSSIPPSTDQSNRLEIVSLSKLSSNLERLLIDCDFDCTDADIVVEGVGVGVHRCILAARSKLFRDVFAKGDNKNVGKRHKYRLNELLPSGGRVRREAFMIFLGYLYTGRLKLSPPDVSTCVDPSCAHDACRPAINFAVELMYASSVFQIPELVSPFQGSRSKFVHRPTKSDFSWSAEQLGPTCLLLHLVVFTLLGISRTTPTTDRLVRVLASQQIISNRLTSAPSRSHKALSKSSRTTHIWRSTKRGTSRFTLQQFD